MPITEHQRRARRGKLGSSDAPAIVGVSPWRSPSDVYWSKKTTEEAAPSKAMMSGNRLEAPLLDFASEQLGISLVRNQYRVSKGADNGLLAAHLDGILKGKREAVECKYVGQRSSAEWGQAGTDEVPDHVIIQCQHQIYTAELDRVWVAAAVAGFQLDWRLYCVGRHDGLIEVLVRQELLFWRQYVERGVPPDAQPPALEILTALKRLPDTIVDLAEAEFHDVAMLEQAKEEQRSLESTVSKAKRSVLTSLGQAEAGRLPDGTLITFLKQNSPPRCDLARLQADHPTIYQEYVTQGTHRVLRIKRPKEIRDDSAKHRIGGEAEAGLPASG